MPRIRDEQAGVLHVAPCERLQYSSSQMVKSRTCSSRDGNDGYGQAADQTILLEGLQIRFVERH